MNTLLKHSLQPIVAAVAVAVMLHGALAPARAQGGAERGPQPLAAEAIQSAIDALGTIDGAANDVAFKARMNAARSLRRAPADAVVPALIKAIQSHQNSYVRFRALVLLTGFNDARTPEVVREIMGNVNDRLRTVAYM